MSDLPSRDELEKLLAWLLLFRTDSPHHATMLALVSDRLSGRLVDREAIDRARNYLAVAENDGDRDEGIAMLDAALGVSDDG
jgi:hypothetical protein